WVVGVVAGGGNRARAVHERGVGPPEVSGAAAIGLGVGDVGGHATATATEALGDNGADIGVFGVLQVGGDGGVAGQETVGAAGVLGAVVVQAAEDGEAMGHLRQARQSLGDIDAGDVGADGAERATHLCGGVGLEVEQVEM